MKADYFEGVPGAPESSRIARRRRVVRDVVCQRHQSSGELDYFIPSSDGKRTGSDRNYVTGDIHDRIIGDGIGDDHITLAKLSTAIAACATT
jgi:hypothetical protein